ncbi:MAG TPA: hypothetical protein VLA21_02760 [Candidatus Limnocylindria bacterium]|nr:hypothetical protein [Candidatus Limnocylindria bacterium]
MRLIDFDSHFRDYLHAWLEERQDELMDIEQVEALMPGIYEGFLRTPADWLEGRTPASWFEGIGGAQLVALMLAYIAEDVPVPDALLMRLEDEGASAQRALVALVGDESAPEEARMLSVRLLRDMGSMEPLPLYVQWQARREDRDDLADAALASLEEMGEDAVLPMIAALEEATDAGREAMLSILSHYPRHPEVYDSLIRLFESSPPRQAVLAAFLGRLGDERALPALTERALEEGLRYHDYIELRSAIEALGGDAPEREFGADPDDAALGGLE